MKKLLLGFLVIATIGIRAQDDDEGKKSFCADVNKKAMSLYEKGTDRKKYQKQFYFSIHV